MSDFVTRLRTELVAAAEREQERALPRAPRPAPRVLLFAGAAAIAAVALLLTLGGLRTNSQRTVHPAATPEPTPTVQPTLKGRDLFGGSLENGVRYRTRAFVPALSFVTNSRDWFVYDGTRQDTLALDLRKQVGSLQQEGPPIATLAFARIPKVYDPSKAFKDSLEPAPAALYAWLRSHPDLRVGRATPVTVAGVRGQRFDAVARFDHPAHEDPLCRQRTLKPCTFIAPNISFLDGERMQFTILPMDPDPLVIATISQDARDLRKVQRTAAPLLQTLRIGR
jgi:hypothetical protein